MISIVMQMSLIASGACIDKFSKPPNNMKTVRKSNPKVNTGDEII